MSDELLANLKIRLAEQTMLFNQAVEASKSDQLSFSWNNGQQTSTFGMQAELRNLLTNYTTQKSNRISEIQDQIDELEKPSIFNTKDVWFNWKEVDVDRLAAEFATDDSFIVGVVEKEVWENRCEDSFPWYGSGNGTMTVSGCADAICNIRAGLLVGSFLDKAVFIVKRVSQ